MYERSVKIQLRFNQLYETEPNIKKSLNLDLQFNYLHKSCNCINKGYSQTNKNANVFGIVCHYLFVKSRKFKIGKQQIIFTDFYTTTWEINALAIPTLK